MTGIDPPDEERFDDESAAVGKILEQQFQKAADYDKLVHHFDLKITPWANVQVEEKKIARRGFYYSRRRMANGSGTNRVLETPVFSLYAWSGEYPTLQVGIGNRYVAKLFFGYDHKTNVNVRLEFLRLFDIQFNAWWPGA